MRSSDPAARGCARDRRRRARAGGTARAAAAGAPSSVSLVDALGGCQRVELRLEAGRAPPRAVRVDELRAHPAVQLRGEMLGRDLGQSRARAPGARCSRRARFARVVAGLEHLPRDLARRPGGTRREGAWRSRGRSSRSAANSTASIHSVLRSNARRRPAGAGTPPRWLGARSISSLTRWRGYDSAASRRAAKPSAASAGSVPFGSATMRTSTNSR